MYIPKSDGRQRPLGIASLEDKLVQRAVADVLNAIYEVDFLGFSYGGGSSLLLWAVSVDGDGPAHQVRETALFAIAYTARDGSGGEELDRRIRPRVMEVWNSDRPRR